MSLEKMTCGVNYTTNLLRDNVNGLIDNVDLSESSFYFQEQGKNLFDKDSAIEGFISPVDIYYESTTYSVSDFIPVIEGESYYGSGGELPMRFVAAYDSEKNVISSAGVSETSYLYEAPVGVSFVRVTFNTQKINEAQFEKNTARTSFEPFGIRRATVDEYRFRYPWAGFALTTFGDSLVAQNRWQPELSGKTGLIATNRGVSGSTVTGANGSTTAICQDARIDSIPDTSDVVMVLGGTNDWAQSVPIGNIEDTDPAASFYGGLNTLYEKLFTRLPEARVFACTPPYSEFIDFASRGWSSATVNNASATIDDYAQAVRNAANKWGVPVIDFNAECGWNEVNVTTYVEDDGALLHPNNKGATRMAEIAISRSNQFKLTSS